MRLSLLYTVFLFLSAEYVFSQSAQVTIGGSDKDQSYDLLQVSDGYIITGYTLSYGANPTVSDVYLIKVGSSGSLAWTTMVGDAAMDEGYGMVQAADGGYAVAGVTWSFGSGMSDMYLLKFTSTGSLSWSKTLGGAGEDVAFDITKTEDGNYILAGYSTSFGSGDEDIFLAKFLANGNLSWSRTFGGTGNERAKAIITVPDGYIMAGSTDSYGQGNSDCYVVKYNTAGTYQWSQAIGGPGLDEAFDIIQDTDGNLVLTGTTDSYGAGINDMYLVKLNSNGGLLWTKTFGNSNQGWGNKLIQASDGNYIVAGGYVPVSKPWNGFIAKYDVSGTLLWEKNYGEPGGPEYINGLIQNNAGEYVMCGSTNSFGGAFDFYITKFTSRGGFCGTSAIAGTESSGGVASGSSGSNTNRALTAGTGGVTGTGGFLTNQCGNLAILPVSLLSFTGKAGNNSAELSWSTASEENNNYFTLERSTDGKIFSEIGKINGAGNSNSNQHYQFIDGELPPAPAAAAFFYRLSQTDYDGKRENLGIVSVKLSGYGNFLSMTIQSNPVATDKLNLNLFSPIDDEVLLSISDLHGKIVSTEKIQLKKNESSLATFDLAGNSKGVYFISVYGKSSSVKSKFLFLGGE
jgi:hypothetical protein